MSNASNDALIARYGLRGTPRAGLAMGTWGFFIGFAAVSLYGPASRYFQSSMHISAVLLGVLVAAPQLTGSLLRIPFGAWVDKGGGRLPMLTLFAVSLVGMWGLVYILYSVRELTMTIYPVILLFGFMSGCGVASFSVGVPQVSYWYPQNRQGVVLGIFGGVGNLAPGLFTLLLPIAIGAWGLTGSYLAWFLFLLVGTAVYAWLTPDAYFFQLRKKGVPAAQAREVAQQCGQELFPKESVWQALWAAAEEQRTWGLVYLYFVSFGGFLALTVWFPTYWINLHNMDVKTAGVLGGLGFSLLAAAIRVFGGVISERFGGERVAVAAFAAVLAGAVLLTAVTQFGVNLLGELVIALGMGIANAAVFKMVPKFVPEAVGGASGWVGGLGALGGFLIPPILGAFVDVLGPVGYAHGFFVYVVLSLAATALAVAFMRAEKAAPAPAPLSNRKEQR
jgi:NNP family nitrate/nitrite transporter-like MFS transporter